MSKEQDGSIKSYGRGGSRTKRGHDSFADGNDDVGSLKCQRIITEEEKKDFISYQKEMDERRDRYERIVKQSRDVIIECKRIIFQLHRTIIVNTSTNKEEVLNEADRRLKEVRNKMLRQIAEELYSLDHYYYLKSYDWALEEYIEALAFYKFLISGEVLLYSEIIDILQFADLVSEENKKFYIELPEITYLMGLFDVGGELMRLAISEISAGNSNTAVNIVNYMRSLHGCYEFLGNIVHTAEWTKKSQVFRDCLMKVENALYKWKIRENDMLIDASLLT
ncbi:Translin family protein [Brugia malayi]|uniref:Bm9095 n=1 Tax=Brugia malayi TaxID=6279 RepID=A0A0K0JY35_BRUMA|nr:Translin family protein [Brugia malayi]CDP92621.1 Bm9095 [Brugia malayi]VIO95909.1 Translin family protein [Brugia malayi]